MIAKILFLLNYLRNSTFYRKRIISPFFGIDTTLKYTYFFVSNPKEIKIATVPPGFHGTPSWSVAKNLEKKLQNKVLATVA